MTRWRNRMSSWHVRGYDRRTTTGLVRVARAEAHPTKCALVMDIWLVMRRNIHEGLRGEP